MKRTPLPEVNRRLLVLLDKNLAALERLTAVLVRLERAIPRGPANRAGLLSQAEVCNLLGIGPDGLYRRIWTSTNVNRRRP